jgi:class 3 adenylate cyclase/HAMP domain-containing protein
MTKFFTSISFKLSVLLLLCYYVYANPPSLKENIFKNVMPFESPFIVIADSKNDIYLIDKRSRRITKMSPAGDVSYILKGGDRARGRFYRAADIAVDDQDRLYVLNAVDNLDDGYVEKNTILRYHPDGRFDKVIAELPRTKQERLGEDRLIVSNINVEDGWVYVFMTEKGAGTSLYRFNGETGMRERVLTIPTEERTIAMCETRDGKRYMTKLDGCVYLLRADGTMTALRLPDLGPDAMFFPWDVEVDDSGHIYTSDIVNQVIAKSLPGNSIEPLFPRNWLDGKEKVIAKSIGVTGEGYVTCINERDNTVYGIKPDGEVAFKLRHGTLSAPIMAFRFSTWLVILAIIFLLFRLMKDIFIKILRRKIPLVLKQLFIFVPAVILSVGYVSYEIFHRLLAENERSIGHELAMYSQISSRLIDGDALERLTRPEHYMNEDYRKLQDQMLSALNYGRDPWNELPYSRLIKYYDGNPYICVDWSGFVGTRYPFLKAQPMHERAFRKGEIGFERYDDIDVGLYAGVAPVRNSKGEIVGVYELMVDDSIMGEVIQKFARQLTSGLIFSVVLFIILTAIVTSMILASIRKLRFAVSRMARGKFETTVDIRTKDEVEDLGRGFNIMSRYIRNYIAQITRLNKAYVRFVPQEFLHFLEKKSIVDMRLGDQVQKEMTVLFSDIRSFTALSEKMTPQENFSFINSYLREVGPVIRNNKGFIDKYIGDAIMALFPGEPEDAILAALNMKQKIREYNDGRTHAGYPPIDIGIGIHTGTLMLGIIGEVERMEGTVISDSVNLASRIEGLTKVYGAGIIVSEETLKKLSDPAMHESRFLDRVRVTGKQKPVLVFEVFEGDPDPIRALKRQTRVDFEKGIGLYCNGKTQEALALFTKVWQANKHDKAAALYIKRCENFIKFGLPADWSGIEAMETK